MLGGVHAHVRPVQERLRGVAFFVLGYPDRNRNTAHVLPGRFLHKMPGIDQVAYTFGQAHCMFDGGIGQDDRKFLTAVSRRGVLSLDIRLDAAPT